MKVMIMINYMKFYQHQKRKKLKINNTLIEKYKEMNEKPDFEQDHWSGTAEAIYKIRHDSTRLMKWIAFYYRSFHEFINYHDMMGSLLKGLNELSER